MTIMITSLQQYTDVAQQLATLLETKKIKAHWVRLQQTTTNSIELGLASARLLADPSNMVVLLDDYGIGSFNSLNKTVDAVCANCYDEHSARMMRKHNNARALTLAMEILAPTLVSSITLGFASTNYELGRDEVRANMLRELLQGEVK
jgi:galactose-6-phosphate isomerase